MVRMYGEIVLDSNDAADVECPACGAEDRVAVAQWSSVDGEYDCPACGAEVAVTIAVPERDWTPDWK